MSTGSSRTREMADYQQYAVSVIDSDGDEVLNAAPVRTSNFQAAWEQALAMAFRVCHGTGAFPTTISVTKPEAEQSPLALLRRKSTIP